MMKKIFATIIVIVLIGFAAPSWAGFADQATYAGVSGGTANAQTITVPNANSPADLYGVLIKFIPGATNTGAATLQFIGAAGPVGIEKPSSAGLVSLTGGELTLNQPVIGMLDPLNSAFIILSVTNTSTTAASLANSALAFGMPVNLQLNASVGSNQLTIAVKGNNGSDPSATNPVLFAFRDTTIANGDPVIVSLQAALSFTIGSGNTMGCVSNQMCRLWILAANNAGAVALCAENVLSGTSVSGINEGILHTSQSGTSGGSSAQLKYCNVSALTNVAMRIIGYVEISEATAGTWATGPTFVQLFGPGIKKPGDVIQTVRPLPISTQTTLGTTQTQTGITASITPSSAANVIEVSSNVNVTGGAGANAIVQLSRGTTPTLFGVAGSFTCAGQTCPTPVDGVDVPNTTSATAYYVFGKSAGTNVIVNDVANTYAPTSTIILREIQSRLEPANDDQPWRMVG
jgi:hypothetical protein